MKEALLLYLCVRCLFSKSACSIKNTKRKQSACKHCQRIKCNLSMMPDESFDFYQYIYIQQCTTVKRQLNRVIF